MICFASLQFFFLQHVAASQLLSGRDESGIQRAQQEHRKVSLLSENQLCLGVHRGPCCFYNEGCLITVAEEGLQMLLLQEVQEIWAEVSAEIADGNS